MSNKMDPYVAKILQQHLPDDIKKEDAIWHHKQSGQWIAKHRTLEIIAAKCGISFITPEIIESDVANGVCVLLAQGYWNGKTIEGSDAPKSEWSIGEASPGNCRNQYPAAMAEKRAKDRVILKLLGLHGYVYSDQEIDTTDEPKKTKKEVMVDAKENSEPFDWYEYASDVETKIENLTTLKEVTDYWKQIASRMGFLKEVDESTHEAIIECFKLKKEAINKGVK